MKNYPNKKNTVTLFVLLSLMAHLVAIYAMLLSGPLTFRVPVQPISAIFVSLKSSKTVPSTKAGEIRPVAHTSYQLQATHLSKRAEETKRSTQQASLPDDVTQPQEPAINEQSEATPLSKNQHTPRAAEDEREITAPEKETIKSHPVRNIPVTFNYEHYKGPVRDAGEFLASKKEKLIYRISLLKIPVGTAVMEASNYNDELRITIKITSNAVFSAVYPVDDLVETRMIKGNYLLTRVRQSEGNFKGDFGFTLMLREHKAFWVDRLTNRFNYQPLPVEDVMDAVSGFYFLRNRTLEVGSPVQLHLFDSNEYSPTTVEVLRKERIVLSDGTEVDTLVLHPLFKTAGFFRRTGDIMIWLTDDTYRVPVRLETSIILGKITAELISVESEQDDSIKEMNSTEGLSHKSDH